VPPSYEDLCEDTLVAYSDMDGSPSKAWMVHHRGEPEVRTLFEMGFGKFPAEELYDLERDPHYLDNVAGDPGHAEAREHLSTRLMAVLREQHDPRVTDPDCRFERSPYTDPHTGF
ncbi:MAG: sulfatase, partial [Deltaproteobacteria bacterium]|nr:sulfatase [Deltaproteobacteria bacterium]